jgi:hypothetical protein
VRQHFFFSAVKTEFTKIFYPLQRSVNFYISKRRLNENSKFDLDMASYALVKSYANKRGTTYTDMTWEPKESFQAVADYYAKR